RAVRNQADAARGAYECAREGSILRFDMGMRTQTKVVHSLVLEALDWAQECAHAELTTRGPQGADVQAAKNYVARVKELQQIWKGNSQASGDSTLGRAFAYFEADAQALLLRTQTPDDKESRRRTEDERLRSASACYQGVWQEYQKGPGFYAAVYDWSKAW